MRKASIVERSELPLDEKAESYIKLAHEAELIVGRMESSMNRLTQNELVTLGPGRKKEMAQLTEAMLKLKTKAKEAMLKRKAKAGKDPFIAFESDTSH